MYYADESAFSSLCCDAAQVVVQTKTSWTLVDRQLLVGGKQETQVAGVSHTRLVKAFVAMMQSMAKSDSKESYIYTRTVFTLNLI